MKIKLNPNKEIVIGSKLNGMGLNLSKGTGVVNAKSTSTLAGLFNMLGSDLKSVNGDYNAVNTNNQKKRVFTLCLKSYKHKILLML